MQTLCKGKERGGGIVDDERMEVGDLIPLRDGWFQDKYTGNLLDPEGRIYNLDNELIYDPTDDDRE